MERLASRTVRRTPLRAGGTALTLISSSLNLEALRHLADGPLPLQDLMRRLGFPPRSTTRLCLRTLAELGAVERRPRSEFPASVDYAISPAGRSLLRVSVALQAWLDASPAGPTELGGTAAKSAVKALVEGWGANLVRALATRPLSLTELNTLIPRISYPSLERRLTAMRQVDLLEAHRRAGRASPYEVTEWLRRAVAPLTAAVGWERLYAAERTPDLRRLDVETAFLLAIPLMEELPKGLRGSCRLAVEVDDGSAPLFAGVLVSVEDGAVTGYAPNLESEAEAWAAGKPLSWLRRMNGGEDGELAIGGDARLAEELIGALRRTVDEPR